MLVRIHAEYDAEADVWVAQSDDIPLVTEADTIEQLRKKLPDVVRDVLHANEIRNRGDVEIDFVAHSREMLAVA
jgi:hypothetical protein